MSMLLIFLISQLAMEDFIDFEVYNWYLTFDKKMIENLNENGEITD